MSTLLTSSARVGNGAKFAAPLLSPVPVAAARPPAKTAPSAAAGGISLVNMAARQRMLSQRMLLQTVLAAAGNKTQLAAAQKSLQLFCESQARLLATADELDEVSAQRVRTTYTGAAGVGPRIERFMQQMHQVLRGVDAGDAQGALLDEMVSHNDVVLEALNTATTTFDGIAKSKADRLMKDLTGIVSDIQTVAREAKIVSFNAQVIAARAGPHGREFAVVAGVLSGISTEVDGLSRKAIELAARNA